MNHPNESGIPWLYSASPLPEAHEARIEGLLAELAGMPPKKAVEYTASLAVATAISGLADGAAVGRIVEQTLQRQAQSAA
jgi:hypothetical protein